MNALQATLLEMLRYFHEICVKNHIRYYIWGGTCLGAVRHKGFIPWDDDLDVAVPRSDYDRLIEVVRNDKNPKYVIETPLENKDYVYSFCKLYDTGTTLVENTRYKTRRGAYIDIFPLDGAGNTQYDVQKRFQKINFYNHYICTKVCAINKHRAFYKNASIILGRCIPEIFFGWRWALKKVDALCRTRAFDECAYVGNLYGGGEARDIMAREVFGEPTLYDFEDLRVFGPADANKYLTLVYGDYMIFPPKEKQVSHHDYLFLDLHKSYIT